GRLDLAQAEAVALLIGARTDRAVALAARALAGGLSDQVQALRDALVDVIAGLEVALDFPEERVGHDVGVARATVARLRADVERWRKAICCSSSSTEVSRPPAACWKKRRTARASSFVRRAI